MNLFCSHLRSSLRSGCGVRCCVKSCSDSSRSCPPTTKFCANSNPSLVEGWVGHPLDPIGCLFDTLADASLVNDDTTPRAPSYFGNSLKFYVKHKNVLLFLVSLTNILHVLTIFSMLVVTIYLQLMCFLNCYRPGWRRGDSEQYTAPVSTRTGCGHKGSL